MLFITTDDYSLIMISKLDTLLREVIKYYYQGAKYVQLDDSSKTVKLFNADFSYVHDLKGEFYYIVSYIFIMNDTSSMTILNLKHEIEEYQKTNNKFFDYKNRRSGVIGKYIDQTSPYPVSFIDYNKYMACRPYLLDAINELKPAISECNATFIGPGINSDEVLLIKGNVSYNQVEPIGIIKGLAGVLIRKVANIRSSSSSDPGIRNIIPVFKDILSLVEFKFNTMEQYSYLFK